MDKIKVKILDDGRLVVQTEGVSAGNHISADDLLETLAKLAGGKRETETRDHHGHTHSQTDNHHHH